jgi:hypothetical protein
MGRILLSFVTAMVVCSCSLTNPGNSNGVSIQVSNATFGPQNRFTAIVKFTNNLGRDVNVLNLGCMSTDSSWNPSFLMEQFVDARWDTFGGPSCTDLAVAPTKLTDGKSLTTVVLMLSDTSATGTFRLRFDIREQDLTQQLPQEYLLSNSFSITK